MIGQWEQSGEYWFYFGPDGYLLWDTTTSDGYQVNGQGRWIVDGAEIYDAFYADQTFYTALYDLTG